MWQKGLGCEQLVVGNETNEKGETIRGRASYRWSKLEYFSKDRVVAGRVSSRAFVGRCLYLFSSLWTENKHRMLSDQKKQGFRVSDRRRVGGGKPRPRKGIVSKSIEESFAPTISSSRGNERRLSYSSASKRGHSLEREEIISRDCRARMSSQRIRSFESKFRNK